MPDASRRSAADDFELQFRSLGPQQWPHFPAEVESRIFVWEIIELPAENNQVPVGLELLKAEMHQVNRIGNHADFLPFVCSRGIVFFIDRRRDDDPVEEP